MLLQGPGRNAGVGVSESGMSLGRKEPSRCINTLFEVDLIEKQEGS